jgi:hypothetical protein
VLRLIIKLIVKIIEIMKLIKLIVIAFDPSGLLVYQELLDAVLFEPGMWQAELAKAPPQLIPAVGTRTHRATPAGYLLNELVKSPANVLSAVLVMLTHVQVEHGPSP